MKFITILLISLFGAISQGMSQDRTIKFEEGDFQSALEAAKPSGKLIFVDAYTSWCGPCKQMAKDVFTQNEVADFFNTNFVNFTVDAEKGEGVTIKERYNIEVYPTFLLVNSAGEEVFRLVGGHKAEAFVESFRNAMNPDNFITSMDKKFEAGERGHEFITKYLNALVQANQREKMDVVLNAYFGNMAVKNICMAENWVLFSKYINDLRNPLFRLMVDQNKEFHKYLDDSIVNNMLSSAYNTQLFSYIINPGDITSEKCAEIEADINKMSLVGKDLQNLQIYLTIARYKMEKKYAAILDLCDAGIPFFTESQWCTLAMSFGFFKDAGDAEKARAFEFVKKEFIKEKARDGGGAQNVLYFLSMAGEAIKG